jgi:toxin HigB-1
MRVEFEDPDLERLFVDVDFRLPALSDQLTLKFRRRLASIVAALDERDLRALKSLHFEKLLGDRKGQYSIRIHKQWRLVFRLQTDDSGKVVVIIEVVDYH